MAKENVELLNARKMRRRDKAAIARLRQEIHELKERLELQSLKQSHVPPPASARAGDGKPAVRTS